jgi:hypothetical protein
MCVPWTLMHYILPFEILQSVRKHGSYRFIPGQDEMSLSSPSELSSPCSSVHPMEFSHPQPKKWNTIYSGMRFTHFLFAQFLNRRFSRIEDSSRRWRWVWEPEQWFGCAIVIIAGNGRLQYFAWTRNWTWIIGGTTFFYL